MTASSKKRMTAAVVLVLLLLGSSPAMAHIQLGVDVDDDYYMKRMHDASLKSRGGVGLNFMYGTTTRFHQNLKGR
jgi:hypothetical protein